ncbi:hypothetical protein SLUN_11760 [Streptomyces lunaelactis]|uniref:Uncharacterized protein n=1 Tax=Streptomyces lunaelactis TaxID=1535768 RepID=A0A2R4T0W7_9ACTN|nr:hypothetical protein [Streptomyces lunaelactis]AVZ72763.1 hypothetical protein SLUN_11760 [Streptomyces lunaelactis]NUK87886.1 hypothetical protein [Streptomyces lunaelactis]
MTPALGNYATVHIGTAAPDLDGLASSGLGCGVQVVCGLEGLGDEVPCRAVTRVQGPQLPGRPAGFDFASGVPQCADAVDGHHVGFGAFAGQ